MSAAALDAVAAAPLAGDIEALQRKLRELRTQIDAILTQLDSQKAPTSAAGCVSAAELLPQEPFVEPILEDTTSQAADAEVDAQTPVVPEPDVMRDAGGEVTAELDTAAAGEPSLEAAIGAESASIAEASELLVDGAEVSKREALIASTDARPSRAVDGGAPESEAKREPAIEVAAPAARAMSTETDLEPKIQTAAADVPASTPAADPATPARVSPAAAVIAFEPRHRKEKSGVARNRAMPVRRGRRIATRIAASIIAVIAAATALAVADRSLVGSAYSLPWMSPLPTYVPSGANWPFLGRLLRAVEGEFAGGRAAHTDTPLPNHALMLRYREVWPTSP